MRFLLLILFCLQAPKTWGKVLILSPGERVLLPAPSDQTLRIKDKSLLVIEKRGENISLLARKQGQSLLVAGDKSYQLFILKDSLKEKALILKQALKDKMGLSWSLSPENKFQIRGRLYRFSDWLDLKEIFKKHNIIYEFKAKMDEELKKISSYYFKQILKKPFEIFWEDLPFVFIPQNSPILPYQKKLKAFGLIPKEQEGWLFKAPLIKWDWAIVENLSVSSFSTGGLFLEEKLNNFSSLLSFLNFIKNSGKGKSLHHSSLIAQSGQKIELTAGGQLPFNRYHFKTEQQSTDWKSFGLEINLMAKLDSKGLISLDIRVNNSEPVSFSGTDQGPSLKQQTLKTTFVIHDRQILKVFEIKKDSRSKNHSGGLIALTTPRSLTMGKNNHQITQTFFIQPKILKEQPLTNQDLKDVLTNEK